MKHLQKIALYIPRLWKFSDSENEPEKKTTGSLTTSSSLTEKSLNYSKTKKSLDSSKTEKLLKYRTTRRRRTTD